MVKYKMFKVFPPPLLSWRMSVQNQENISDILINDAEEFHVMIRNHSRLSLFQLDQSKTPSTVIQ